MDFNHKSLSIFFFSSFLLNLHLILGHYKLTDLIIVLLCFRFTGKGDNNNNIKKQTKEEVSMHRNYLQMKKNKTKTNQNYRKVNPFI